MFLGHNTAKLYAVGYVADRRTPFLLYNRHAQQLFAKAPSRLQHMN